ncbi:restriction endonuclease subunit S [Tetragenococcus halophilus]|uniref:restriction endonuclease subunit S n=1 Tax=Tetragenococcus halophilus TaxID=51669 RepID=UPI001BB2F5D2|nr:restriction endonuclease subunit S [Tetragenococcus halophilus]
MGESLSILKDGTHGTHKNVENGPHLLSAKNIKNGKIKVTEDDRKISQEEYEQIHKNFQLKAGDILLTIVGSIGEAAVLQDPTGITFQRSVAYLRSSEIDTYFLYTLFTGPDFQKELKNRQVVSAQPGIYLGDISKIIIRIPKGMKEQRQIGKFFKQLDNATDLHQRKLKILKSIKKSCIQFMFPKNEEKTPKVRFTSFYQNWRLCKFEEILIEFNKKSEEENQYPVLSSTNYGMEKRDGKVSGKSNLGYKIVNDGDLVLSPQNLWLGNINVNDMGLGLVSPSYKTFRFNKINNKFIEPQLRVPRMLEEYKNSSTQGASIVRRNLDLNAFFQIKIKVPNTDEQTKIGLFLKKIDNVTSLYQTKLEKLQTFKKVLLQNMFI